MLRPPTYLIYVVAMSLLTDFLLAVLRRLQTWSCSSFSVPFPVSRDCLKRSTVLYQVFCLGVHVYIKQGRAKWRSLRYPSRNLGRRPCHVVFGADLQGLYCGCYQCGCIWWYVLLLIYPLVSFWDSVVGRLEIQYRCDRHLSGIVDAFYYCSSCSGSLEKSELGAVELVVLSDPNDNRCFNYFPRI